MTLSAIRCATQGASSPFDRTTTNFLSVASFRNVLDQQSTVLIVASLTSATGMAVTVVAAPSAAAQRSSQLDQWSSSAL
jgi:hypothetical protein